MFISLVGYMGSGKTHVSNFLKQKLNLKKFDLDSEISNINNGSIAEIFEKRGELYFRKQENRLLHEIFSSHKCGIISTGGGTPAYYNNMEIINQYSISIYLRASIGTLYQRLQPNKSKRPLIANISDENLSEFIAKHLFERNAFYTKAHYIIDTDNKTPEEIADEIILKLDANKNSH